MLLEIDFAVIEPTVTLFQMMHSTSETRCRLLLINSAGRHGPSADPSALKLHQLIVVGCGIYALG